MRILRSWQIVAALLLALLIPAASGRAAHVTLDGDFTDWTGEACFSDTGLADDEASPRKADITEFCSTAETGSVYLLMGWDDTSFTGGNASTAAVTVRGANGNYYRVYTTASGNPGSAPLASLLINTCGTDSTCASETEVCDNTDASSTNDCTGAGAGSSTSWTDPFSGRASPDCSGTSCGSQDTAVELLIPWSLVGGEPSDGQTVFLNFASYPSGPGQGEKDVAGANGITCQNQAGSFVCFPSTPTVITLATFRAGPVRPAFATLSQSGAYLLTIVILLSVALLIRFRST